MSCSLKEKLYTLWKRRYPIILAALITGALAGLYAGLLANKTMPPAEGWYSYYAYLMNEEGAVPYVDFELLFPPLYVYLIALFTRIFGYSILALRIFGAVIYAATGVFACLIFEKLTHKAWVGLLAGVLTVSVLQSEVVQVFYDYVRIMDLFVYAAVYFFLRYLDKIRLEQSREDGVLVPRLDGNVIAGAVFAVLASMCKQSSGLIFLLFCLAFFVFLLIFLPHKKELALQIGVIVGVTAILYAVMWLMLATQGALDAYFHYNFVSSVDAKGGGSLLQVLFGWIPRSKQTLLQGLGFVLIPLLLLAASVFLSLRFPAEKKEEQPRYVGWLQLGIVVLLALSVVLPFLFGRFANAIRQYMNGLTMYVAFLFGLIFFVASAFAVIFRKRISHVDWHRHYKYVFLSGVIFTLAYSVCTSGGLSESQTAMGYTFMPVVLIAAASYRWREITAVVMSVAMLFQTNVCFSRKVDVTYGWWGLETGTVSEQTETCNVSIFKGIKMNTAYVDMYTSVVHCVAENTAPQDEIFVFPHMPILYVATDRPRATQTAIQWFDVATDEAVVSDIDVIREKKPKVMVLCEIGDYVMTQHESSFRNGEKSGLRQMQEFLNRFVIEEGYTCYSSHQISSGYMVTVWYIAD